MKTNANLILKNGVVHKLRKYSRSYGSPERVTYPYIMEYGNEIRCYSELGYHQRTFRKGTKLLISFTGKQIAESTYQRRVRASIKEWKAQLIMQQEVDKVNEIAREATASRQLEEWKSMLVQNPGRVARYQAKINTSPSNSSRRGNWRNWIRMKAAKHINDGKFDGLQVSAPALAEVVYDLS